MGIEYYVFSIFIAALICIVAIIFKVLFSDVKRQNKLLDERETHILQLYNSVETIAEEFQDQAKATIDELKLREQEYRDARRDMSAFLLPPELERKDHVNAINRAARVPRANSGMPDANRIKTVGDVIERAERFVNYEPAASQVSPPVSEPVLAPAPFEYFVTDDYDAAQAAAPVPDVSPAPKQEVKPVVFQSFFDVAAEAPPPTPYAPASINGGSRRDAILALADEGKTDVEIASQLGITRNEVQLVIGLTR